MAERVDSASVRGEEEMVIKRGKKAREVESDSNTNN